MVVNEKTKNTKKISYKILISGIVTFGFFTAILLLIAWRLDYWQAWIFGGTGFIMILLFPNL